MATSGSKSITVTSYDTLKFSWEEASQDITNNKTKINWKLQLISTAYGKIISSYAKDWSVTVNGTKYSGTNYVDIGNNATKTLASGSTTISHNDDGTKTFSYSFSQEFAIYFNNSYIGTKSGSGTGTLDTIPRSSTFGTITGNTIGSSMTVNITRNSTDFTHQLWYKVGESSWVDLGKGIATSKTFTIDMEMCAQFPNATSGKMQLCIRTFNGSTQIGSDVYKDVTVYVPDSVKPSCRISVTDPTGHADKYGYVKGLSKFKVVISTIKAYGSDIASYSTTANDATYTAATFTTDELKSSGSLQVKATVKDKRGRTGAANALIVVQDYSAPIISKMTVGRCNEDGTANEEGGFVKVTISGSVTSLNNRNSASYVLEYKKTTEKEYPDDQTITLDEYTNVYSVTDAVYIFEADSGSSYNVKLTVTDDFGSTPKSTVVSTAHAIMHFNASGKGMAFGKVSEYEDYADFGYKVRCRDNILTHNGVGLRGLTTDGKSRSMAYMSDQNNMVFGNGSYYYQEGIVYYYGHDISIKANETITSNKTITVSSDRRLKENIVRFEDVAMFTDENSDVYTELFDRLQPVSFNYIDGNGKVCFGFIAQDVIEALNELGIDEKELDLINEVQLEEGGEKTFGIAYGNLHALQIHKIKKLEEKIKKLESIVEQLAISKQT